MGIIKKLSTIVGTFFCSLNTNVSIFWLEDKEPILPIYKCEKLMNVNMESQGESFVGFL